MSATITPPGRKTPMCRTCDTPMKGHKRVNGSPICPNHTPPSANDNASEGEEAGNGEAAKPSPKTRSPPSQRAHPHRSPPKSPIVQREAALIIPAKGEYRSDHPDWATTPAPNKSKPQYLNHHQPQPSQQGQQEQRLPKQILPSISDRKLGNKKYKNESPREASLVPTLLVDDDGRTIRGSDDEGGDEDEGFVSEGEYSGGYGKVGEGAFNVGGQGGRDVVSLLKTKRRDIPYIKENAKKMGEYAEAWRVTSDDHSPTGGYDSKAVNKDRNGKGKEKEREKGLAREDSSWLMAVGERRSFVKEVANLLSRTPNTRVATMPGTIASSSTEMVEGPRFVTFTQLMIAGGLGGLVVVTWLSFW